MRATCALAGSQKSAAVMLAGLALAPLLPPSGARAQGYTYTTVALHGEPAPGTGGGTYAFPFSASINDSGDVAFRAQVTGGTTLRGVFADSGGTGRAVALEGDTAPGTGGGTYDVIDSPLINASGDVVFKASVIGGTVGFGIFVDSGGTDTAVALLGDPAPGTGGGAYSSLGAISINASGDVAFQADVAGGSVSDGIFVSSGGMDTAVVLGGDAAPGTGGGSYSDLLEVSISDSGDVAFRSSVAGGTAGSGIFVSSGGTDTAVAVEGDAAPGTGGGSYLGFGFISINASGDVAFRAFVAVDETGVFVASGGTDTAVARIGDPAPGTGGGVYNDFSFTESAWINASGDVVFWASVAFGSASSGIFVDSGGTDAAVVLEGDAAPGGGTFDAFSLADSSIDISGDVAFGAGLLGGAQGIFAATAPLATPVPLASGWGVALLSAFLVATGFVVPRIRVRRQRRNS